MGYLLVDITNLTHNEKKELEEYANIYTSYLKIEGDSLFIYGSAIWTK